MATIIRKVFIGNLPIRFRSDKLAKDLLQSFKQCGPLYLEDIQLPRNHDSGRLKGFGFLSFETAKAAENAVKLDGLEFHGRKLRVSFAKDRETRRQERHHAA